MKLSRPCRDCGRRIYVLKLPSKRWMPVDADSSPKGNIRIDLKRRSAVVLSNDDASAARMAGEPLHLSHFADCPYGPKNRRRR